MKTTHDWFRAGRNEARRQELDRTKGVGIWHGPEAAEAYANGRATEHERQYSEGV